MKKLMGLFLSVLLFVGCKKKEPNDRQVQSLQGKVKTVVSDIYNAEHTNGGVSKTNKLFVRLDSFNEDGQLVYTASRFGDGNVINYKETYSEFTNGSRVRTTSELINGVYKIKSEKVTYKLDGAGRVVEECTDNFRTIIYSYNENGHILSRNEYTLNGYASLNSYGDFVKGYPKEGKTIRGLYDKNNKDSISHASKHLIRFVYGEFDSKGNWLQELYTSFNEDLQNFGSTVYMITYRKIEYYQ